MTKQKLKSAAKSTGNAFLTGLTVVANATTSAEIDKIDAQMEELQQQMDQLQEERDRLEQRLIAR